MLGELIPKGGGDPIPLLQPKLVIGRRSSCDIVLTFPNISSEHCELELLNGYWQVRDLNSRNGIKVNGERHDQRFLQPGDELSIAKHHYEIRYQPTSSEPPPQAEDPFEMSLMEKAGLENKKRQQQRERPLPLPPSAGKKRPQSDFDADEDAALDWLMGDS